MKRQDWTPQGAQSTRRELIETFGGWLSGPTGVVTSPTNPAGDRGDKAVAVRYPYVRDGAVVCLSLRRGIPSEIQPFKNRRVFCGVPAVGRVG